MTDAAIPQLTVNVDAISLDDDLVADDELASSAYQQDTASFYTATETPNITASSSRTQSTDNLTASAKSSSHPPPARLKLCIRDVTSRDKSRWHEIFPNTREPFEIDNHMCHGKAILKVKTTPVDPFYAPYFEGKKRMFEIMIEGRLKQVTPNDRLFIGIESDRPLVLNGLFSSAAAAVVTTLVEYTVPHAHCTLGDEQEVCQLVFPLDTTVDRFIVTKPGEDPPEMGVAMFPEQYGDKHGREPLDAYNNDDIYSFSLHSMYLDLANWQLTNLPGIGSVDLDAFFEGMPLRFVGYVLPKDHTGPQRQRQKNYLFSFDLDHKGRNKEPKKAEGFLGLW